MGNDVVGQVVNAIVVPVAAIAAPIVAGYVILLLHTLAKRVGLQVSAEQELQTRQIVQNAILSVEELARQRLKTSGQRTGGDEKRVEATTVAQARLPQKPPQEVANLINEELPKVRAALAPAIAPPVVAPLIIPTPPEL